ncbi:transposase [Roseateles amylovorans]|uniref:Transposase n=1 Tax=Roseateles amylovorans TaxID=2978473 RepID=A0ABY6B3P0_9BURK|nr:transposase [Roseateles amylovorans]UXH79345.1 transposase [Roseateles amylovorans]
MALAGHLHHLIHRGHNLQPIAQDDDDRRALLAALQDCAATHKVAIHAYVVMPNHLHLLVTPSTDDGLSRTMQALGRRYVAAYNQRHSRVGTLWEGRFRAAPIEAEAYLLPVMRSIELNPQRAGLVQDPADYVWSSAAHHLGRRRDPLLTDPPGFWALGNTPFERELAWRRLLEEGEQESERKRLVDAALKGWPLGSARFLQLLGDVSERPLTPRPRGRPPKIKPVPI